MPAQNATPTVMIGDTVELKCGGPRMTVSRGISPPPPPPPPGTTAPPPMPTVQCVWMNTQGELQVWEFPVQTLVVWTL